MKGKLERNELGKYTKKEQLQFAKEIKRMSDFFEGLVSLTKLPDLIFVVDAGEHAIAIREAKRVNVPVVAVLDSNDNPELVTVPVFGNDHSKTSIAWILDMVTHDIHKK
jgi:small subunit ribosomal protein S2